MHSYWNRWRWDERRRNGSSRARSLGTARLRVETLETRELLAVVVPSLSATEGFPFNGQVATFDSTDVQGNNPQASISWGDGHVTTGVVVTNASSFSVTGANTYAVPGNYPVTVTIAGTGGSVASGQGQTTVAPVALLATGTTISPTARQPFTGMVASFTDPYSSLNAASYLATIAWGNGNTTIGTIAANGRGGFDVSGTNTYATPDPQTINVTITRIIDNQTATATSTAVVVNAPFVLSGQLNPLSDTGPSNTDGITAINQPTFIGTADPFSIVQLYARRSDQAEFVLLGQAIASVGGSWHLTVGALPDGAYSIAVAEIPPAGPPTPMVPLTPGSQLVIDTKRHHRGRTHRTIAAGGITDLAGNPQTAEFIKVSPAGFGHPGARHSSRIAAHSHN
jgi:hypothetical protein